MHKALKHIKAKQLARVPKGDDSAPTGQAAANQPKKGCRERSDAPEDALADLPERGRQHYVGDIPVAVSDLRHRLAYRSRRHDPKVAVHWGQRKLLMSELQALLPPFTNTLTEAHDIVYVGAAPGRHLLFLDGLFNSGNQWTLIDPGAFEADVVAHSRFEVLNVFCDNQLMLELFLRRVRSVAPAVGALVECAAEDHRGQNSPHQPIRPPPRNNSSNKGSGDAAGSSRAAAVTRRETGDIDSARMTVEVPTMAESEPFVPVGLHLLARAAAARRKSVFISDVRSGDASMPNFHEHVAENMAAQAIWTRLFDPTVALLKYRLPYSSDPGSATLLPRYLDGRNLLPIWGPQTTTECRLVVTRPDRTVAVDIRDHEDRLFYFNAVLRERVHFNHGLDPRQHGVDFRYDTAAEEQVWRTYMEARREAGNGDEGLSLDGLVSTATQALGESFSDIRRKRDVLLSTSRVVYGGSAKRYRAQQQNEAVDVQGGTEDDSSKRGSASAVRVAAVTRDQLHAARSAAVWWRPVDVATELDSTAVERAVATGGDAVGFL